MAIEHPNRRQADQPNAGVMTPDEWLQQYPQLIAAGWNKGRIRGSADDRAVVQSLAYQEYEIWSLQHDDLTGCLNRAGLEGALNERDKTAFNNLPENQIGTLVLFIDGDRIKKTNDVHGHAAGDEAIKSLGQKINDLTRSTDIVARIGGDEFCVIMDITDNHGLEGEFDADEAVGVLKDRLSSINFMAGDVALNIGASIGHGYVEGFASKEDIQQLLRNADAAMYEHKQKSR